MTARATAKTPTIAISRALRAIGLKQGKDFKVEGRYEGKGELRERIATDVLVLGREADEKVAEHADVIEAAASADGGWSFRVSVYYVEGRERPTTSISNIGSRVRQAPPAKRPAAHELPKTEPVVVSDTEEAKAYMAGSLHAYLMEADAMVGDSETDKKARAALEAAEMQTWKGGSSAWVAGSKATLLEMARYLYSLAELVSTGVVTAAETGSTVKGIEKAAVRFAEAAGAA
ncbi:hypothetical protein ABZT26_25795 [Streptomyces sp. NPDC005395]|uniref:hypothetical protein n=1 Tax=Streptomyces sp. NPDC005395 TaxID=3157042 RepID=UPI0033B473B5